MLKDSPNLPGGVLTQKNDPRILPAGKFLRKTKINELPQLINIFLGQVSIIGPRPQAKWHYDLYSNEIKKCIDLIPPGLSGIGSIVFCNEEKILDKVQGNRAQFHDTVIVPYKGELEVWYCKHRNLQTNWLLILITMWVLIKPQSTIYSHIFKDLPIMPKILRNYV
jgi:lipopolysaccharide/colanic/teichoic acid biosynthesis glycosyltransferase